MNREYVEHAAIVRDSAAWLISRILTSPRVRDLLDHPPIWIERDHLVATVDAIHQAARAFEVESSARERGNNTRASAVMECSEWSTQQAADHLNLSIRRMQEIAPQLGGTLTGRRWRIPAIAVQQEYQRRRTA